MQHGKSAESAEARTAVEGSEVEVPAERRGGADGEGDGAESAQLDQEHPLAAVALEGSCGRQGEQSLREASAEGGAAEATESFGRTLTPLNRTAAPLCR